jgi:hypothetical protein
MNAPRSLARRRHAGGPTAREKTSSRLVRGLGRSGLLLVLLSAVLLAPAPAALAAGAFTGGFVTSTDYPHFMANDHTVYAVRFTNTTLAPPAVTMKLAGNTKYYVKIRFFETQYTPGGDKNRGFVWNDDPTSPNYHHWVQERVDDWTMFPSITTDADGNLPDHWFLTKLGDAAVSGPRYICAALSIGIKGNTLNSTVQPMVTVFDPATAGYWVHNAGSTAEPAGVRAELADVAPAAALPGGYAPFALVRTEPNACDDDADGVVDNERAALYGSGADRAGDVRMAVPVTSPPTTFWTLFRPSEALSPDVPPWGQSFAGAVPDVDLALDAVGDTVAPTAPDELKASPRPGSITLSWQPSADAKGPVGRYIVYRWTDATSTVSTPVKTIVAGLPATQLSYTDSTVSGGTRYSYELRAEDAQTNVGPRSLTVSATPQYASALTLATPPAVVAWNAAVTLTGTLTYGSALALPGQIVSAQASPDGTAWTRLGNCTAGAVAGQYIFVVHPTARTQYRLSFAALADYTASSSEPAVVTPRPQTLGTPSAPAKVRKGKAFAVSGVLKPHHTNGAHSVVIKCFLKSRGKWVLKKTVRATNYALASYSTYRARVTLATVGSWRMCAYYADSVSYAATTSPYRTFRVVR